MFGFFNMLAIANEKFPTTDNRTGEVLVQRFFMT